MKVDLEIIYSCTIKKKKSCPKIKWIGKEREKLYVLESQKVSSLDPNNGNVKRISSRIKSFQKSIVSHNITDNGIYFVAVLVNGDILIWNKDTDTIKIVNGMSEFALKLNNHGPNVFLSNDAKKIILIRNSNKIFVWESEDTSSVVGNWSNIVASKEIKTVEDHKELVIHVRFVQNSISGTHANCCFVFNHENKTRINVLRIKWDNCNTKPSECRFNTMWISHEPTLENFLNQRGCDKNENLNSKQNANFEPLNTRGAYVLKISHNSDLAVLAVNQRKIENCLLLFFSLSNGKIREVNLRNFGLNGSAQGRKYWIQELCWTFNDLFVAGISKHGAFFLVTRLGQPLFIHALGKEINIGPALFLTIHPLILVRGKNDSTIKNDESSINSTLNNGKHQKQIFSISQHPSLPIVVCSDGFLMCILKIPSAFAEPLRLVKEFVNEAVEQMNSISKSTDKHRSFHFPRYQQNDEDGQKFKTKKKRSVSFESNIPDWGLETRSESNFLDKSSDSGVDSINELNKQNKTNGLADHKIADGKIIFSFLPQVLPISDETMSTQSLSSKLEICISYLTCSWSLMVSLNNYDSVDFNENEIVCRAIQQAFINFTTLFLNAEFEAIKDFVYFSNHDLAQSEQIDIKKFKVLVKIFFIFVKTLNFACTDSIHFVHISQFVQKFNQSILKFNNSSVEVDGDRSSSRIYILSLAYNVLKCSQTILKEVFDQQQSESFLIKFDSIECKQNTQHCKELANVNARKQLESHEPSDKSNGSESDRFETDSLEKLNSKKRALILKKSSVKQALNQIDLMLQKGWTNLVHYASKYRKTLQSLGKIRQDSLNQINLFVIFVQREIEKLSNFRHFAWEKSGRRAVVEQVSNRKSLSNFKVAKADLVYFNLGNLDKALDFWTIQLNSMFDQGHTFALEQTSIAIVHKIFYSCLTKYEIGKFLAIVEKFLECEQCKYSKSGQSPFSRFSLFENSFRSLCAPKPLPKLPPAIISVLKSLARFISLYLINNHELFHLSVINPMPMPSLIECLQKPRLNAKKNILSKQQFTLSLNSSGATANIQCVFTADKVVELFLATELYDEAIYFLNSINDWKSSFLINCVLKESSNYQTIDQNSTLSTKFFAEHQLVFKVSSILGLGVDDGVWHDFESCLMEKKYEQSASVVLKELLVCSVVTKSPILEPILNNLMRNFVACTHQMCSSSIIVPENFYLPAPPIFCTQLNCEDNEAFADQFALHESKYRNKLCTLSKCIIVLFKESNLFVPMIKWYLENLSLAKGDMTNVYGIKNKFSLDLSLNTLLSSIRYQKIGYIPQPIFSLFREFVVLLFLIDLRDKFCQALRHFYKLMAKSANSSTAYVDLSCKIIKYGMLILSFRTLMASEYERIQDIVLSTMAKLAPSSQHSSELDLEYELLRCVEEKLFVANLALDKDNLVNSHGQGFNVRHKFEAIREEWKKSGRSAANLDMNDLDTFEHKMKIVKNQSQLIQNHYGIGEDIFHMKYVQNISSLDDSLCGAFAVERSDLMGHFLEFFFKFAFDQSENWEAIVHHVNNIPLIPQFYEAIREQELNKNELKKYVLKNTAGHVSAEWSTDLHINLTKQRRSRLSTNSSKQHKQSTKSLVDAELFTKNGLFRTYSLKNIDHTRSSLGKKSASFNDLKKPASTIKASTCSQTSLEQPLKLVDYGASYAHVSILAIWLVKWSRRFQKILVENSQIGNRFDNGKHLECKTTLKLNSLNANMLVACVYLANDNNLIASSMNEWTVPKKPMSRAIEPKDAVSELDDDFTQVTRSNMATSKKTSERSMMNKKFNNDISSSETNSSTLDISSFNEIKIEALSIGHKPKSSANNEHQAKIWTSNGSFFGKDEPFMEALPSALDLTEYYDFENLKKSHHLIRSLANVELKDEKKEVEPAVSARVSASASASEPKIDNVTTNQNQMKKKKNSFEFITSLFKSSPSPTRSPSRPQKTEEKIQSSISSENKAFASKDKKSEPLQNQEEHPKSTTTTLNETNSSQVHQIIKNELRKIVQLQHNTVMNFLNNQSNEPCEYNRIEPSSCVNQSSMDCKGFENQLITILKSASSSDPMSQIVIETNVKKVQNKSNEHFCPRPEPQVTSGGFLQPVNAPKRNQNILRRGKCSKYVKIPLLNIGDQSEFRLPHVTNPSNENFTTESSRTIYLSAEYNDSGTKLPIASSIKMQSTQNLKAKDKIFERKHLQFLSQEIKKGANSSSKNYPLLKLDVKSSEACHTHFSQAKTESKQVDEANIGQASSSNSKQEVRSIDGSRNTQSSDAGTQVQKPIYDGYILAPDCFDQMLDGHHIDNFSSSKAHYESTRHLRVQQQQAKKKDSHTMTEKTIQTSHQLPPDILFKLKFDSNQKDRQKDCELGNDFINIADLDNGSVEEILQLIEIDQTKRHKVPAVESEQNAQDLNNQLNVSRSIERNDLDRISRVQDSHIETDLSSAGEQKKHDSMADTIEHANEPKEHSSLPNDVFSSLPIIDAKIQSIGKMADKISEENVRNMKCVEAKIEECVNRIESVERNCRERKSAEKQRSCSPPNPQIQIDGAQNELKKFKHIDLSDDLSDLNDLEQQRLNAILRLDSCDHLLVDPSSCPLKAKRKLNDSKQKPEEKKIALGKKQSEQLKKSHDNVSFTKRVESELIEKRESMIEKFAQKREQDAKNLLKDLISDSTQVTRDCSQRINSARSNRQKSSPLKNHISPRKNTKNQIEIPPLLLSKANDADSSVLSGAKVSTPKQARPSLMSRTINKLALEQQIENKKTQILLDELEKRAHNVTNGTIDKVQIKVKDNKSLSDYVRLQNPKKLRTQPVHKALTYSERLMMHQKSDIKLANSKDNINELYKVYGSKRVKGIHQNLTRPNLKHLKPAVSHARLENGSQKKILQNSKNNVKNKVPANARYSPYDQCVLSKDIEELIHWSIDDSLKKIIYDHKPKSRINNKSKINKNNKDLKLTRDMDQDTLADLDIDYLNDEFLDDYLIDNQSYLNQVGLQDLINISLSSESSISFIDWDQIDQICEHYQK